MTNSHITKKQEEILLLIYRFRFLTRFHLQTILHHKDEKRVNEWIKDLVEKHYLGRIVQPEKLKNTPHTIYLSINGIKHIKTTLLLDSGSVKKLYAERKRSEAFINTALFIADIYVNLLSKYEINPNFVFYTRNDFSPDGLIKILSPHCVFRKGKDKRYFIVEVIADSMPRFAIRNRIIEFVNFFIEGEWKNQELPPHILFVCPSSAIELYITTYVLRIHHKKLAEMQIFTTTTVQVKEHGIEAKIWNEIELESEKNILNTNSRHNTSHLHTLSRP